MRPLETRTCACGKTFQIKPYSKQQCCSSVCGANFRKGKTGFKDMTGLKVNLLTATRQATDDDKKHLPVIAQQKIHWVCTCDCGKTGVIVAGGDLRSGAVKSCGCARTKRHPEDYVCEVCGKTFSAIPYPGRPHRACSNECKIQLVGGFHKRKDYVGKRFGRLTVQSVDETLSAALDGRKHCVLHLNCKCDCGKELVVKANALNNGQKSCGCYRKELTAEDNRISSATTLYKVYAKNAANRMLPFDLSLSEFMHIAGQKCHYCGALPNTQGSYCDRVQDRSKAFPATGVDRKDAKLGYSLENCVSACSSCNLSKQSMTYDDYRQHLLKSAAHIISQATVEVMPSAELAV